MLTRRQFNLAAAATLLLPSLRLRPEYDLHGYLAGMCGEHPSQRFDLTLPYVMEGHAYGTDAKIMGRIESSESDTDSDQRKIPRETVDVWLDHWQDKGGWQPLPQLSLVHQPSGWTDACPFCDPPECDVCEGEGYTYQVIDDDFPEYSHSCRKCDGHGCLPAPSCPNCHGRFWEDHPTLQPFGDKLIHYRTLRKFKGVPGIMWSRGAANVEAPIILKSDIGIEAIAMPVVPEWWSIRYRSNNER